MSPAKTLIIAGAVCIAAGTVAAVAGRFPWTYSWFGNLPGDIKYEGDRTFVFAPIISMLVVSAAVSAVLYLVQRLNK